MVDTMQHDKFDFDEVFKDTVRKLRATKEDVVIIRIEISEYICRANRFGLVADEITDYFCVCTPSIIDECGYSDLISEKIVAVFDDIHSNFQRSKNKR